MSHGSGELSEIGLDPAVSYCGIFTPLWSLPQDSTPVFLFLFSVSFGLNSHLPFESSSKCSSYMKSDLSKDKIRSVYLIIQD